MIRKYNEKEIPTLIQIWELSSTLAHPFLDSAFTQIVKKAMTETYLPNSNTWVYEESNIIIGFISMIENEIGGLFVHPNHHSKGIGTLLVNHINQFHKELEVEVFNENKIGKPFYEKHGFKIFKEYIQEGTNQKVLRMKKQ
ncbi:GNAT family N-acetyltransferase [Flavivirga spongiicola]|uniref:GNAT family N-acetyltransferase n=1 Tax=Flavivirga spongiicola TaxID=421621 RepID=A0ABU7XMX8_9FLAO|nr:GNAT family N-acetyltransferase [Flavivirga sp. MEBiC05379]MDO5981766.1 GNAT family N-acetyltransferase [Flavivirga sp. MEBiC05379]